jgi:hypothetical protein
MLIQANCHLAQDVTEPLTAAVFLGGGDESLPELLGVNTKAKSAEARYSPFAGFARQQPTLINDCLNRRAGQASPGNCPLKK